MKTSEKKKNGDAAKAVFSRIPVAVHAAVERLAAADERSIDATVRRLLADHPRVAREMARAGAVGSGAADR